MALKDWLDTGKCMLGFHQGEWVRADPASCVLIQSCDRCRTINQRVEHDWPDWSYRSETDCALERSCKRCAETEARVEHNGELGNTAVRTDANKESSVTAAVLGPTSTASNMPGAIGDTRSAIGRRCTLVSVVRLSRRIFPSNP